MNDTFFKIQQQIRQNAAEHHKFVEDLNKWRDDTKQTEEDLLHKRIIQARERAERQAFNASQVVSRKAPSRTTAPQAKKQLNTAHYNLISSDTEKEYLHHKQEGNAAFKQADYKTAMFHYTRCLDCLPNDPVVLSNRAQALLLYDVPTLAVEDCTAALSALASYTPVHVGTKEEHTLSAVTAPDVRALKAKTLFRRACARKMMCLWGAALADLDAVQGSAAQMREVALTRADVKALMARDREERECAERGARNKAGLVQVRVAHGLDAAAGVAGDGQGDGEEWEEVPVVEAEEDQAVEVGSGSNVPVSAGPVAESPEDARATQPLGGDGDVGADAEDRPSMTMGVTGSPPTSAAVSGTAGGLSVGSVSAGPESVDDAWTAEEVAEEVEDENEDEDEDEEDEGALPPLATSSAELEVSLRQLAAPLQRAVYLLAHADMALVARLCAPLLDASLLGSVLCGCDELLQLQARKAAEGDSAAAAGAASVMRGVAKLLKTLGRTRGFSLAASLLSEEEQAAARAVVHALRVCVGDDKYTQLVGHVARLLDV